MSPEQKERAAKLMYETLWGLIFSTPWEDLDTERASGHRHIGSSVREVFYDLADKVEAIANENA